MLICKLDCTRSKKGKLHNILLLHQVLKQCILCATKWGDMFEILLCIKSLILEVKVNIIMSTKFNLCLRCASHISKSSAVQGSCVSSYLFILAVQNVLLTTHILL